MATINLTEEDVKKSSDQSSGAQISRSHFHRHQIPFPAQLPLRLEW